MMDALKHYLGVAVLILVAYFFLVAPFFKHQEYMALHGNNVSVTQPVPTSKAEKLLEDLAAAAKSNELSAALQGQTVQTSAASQAVATAITQVTGANAELANALAAGLLKPPPKVEVITVGTKPTAGTSTTALTNGQIQSDMAHVLNDPNTKVHVDTTVHVTWEDKPFSPFFAVYTSNAAAGMGYTIRGSKPLDLDALLLRSKQGNTQAGIGVSHLFHGTSASIGLDGAYDFTTKRVVPSIYVGVHF